jgi:hypothetical protein
MNPSRTLSVIAGVQHFWDVFGMAFFLSFFSIVAAGWVWMKGFERRLPAQQDLWIRAARTKETGR